MKELLNKLRRIKTILFYRQKIKKLNKELKEKLLCSEKKEVKEYYKKYNLKIKKDWHKFYKNFRKFSRYNIPEDLFYSIIEPKLNIKDFVPAYTDKNMYDKLYPKFKKPNTVLRNINGVFKDSNYKLIDNLQDFLEKLDEGKYIIKPTIDTYGGKNDKSFEKKFDKFYENDKEIDILEFLNSFTKNFIVQEKIKQSQKIAKLHENSLNTLRVMSYRDSNDIKILSIVLRVGNNGSVVDNPATSGGFTLGVNKYNGTLTNYGVDKFNGIIKEIHPFTKVKFCDVLVPNIELLKETIINYHREVPEYFDLISWDIGIDENDNFIFIELNISGQELNFHQKLNGPIFGEETDKILKRVTEDEKKKHK